MLTKVFGVVAFEILLAGKVVLIDKRMTEEVGEEAGMEATDPM